MIKSCRVDGEDKYSNHIYIMTFHMYIFEKVGDLSWGRGIYESLRRCNSSVLDFVLDRNCECHNTVELLSYCVSYSREILAIIKF